MEAEVAPGTQRLCSRRYVEVDLGQQKVQVRGPSPFPPLDMVAPLVLAQEIGSHPNGG